MATDFPAPRHLNAKEAANALNLSESFLAKLRISGTGPAFLKLGRRVLYDPADLVHWASAKRRISTSDTRSAA